MSDFKKVTVKPDKTVIYEREDGSGISRQGGTLSWRNNNPGNIVYGDYAKGKGAIGKNGRFAVFPDVESGYQAVGDLLSAPSYRDLSVEGAMNRYAPKSENNTERYIQFIEKSTQIERGKRVGDLDNDERELLVKTISRYEGFQEGDEYHFKKYLGDDRQ